MTRWFERYVEMTPSTGNADAYLDGLRAIAVLSVIGIHVYQHANEPHIPLLGNFVDHQLATASWPVPMFFTLSAYLLSQPWFKSEISDRPAPKLSRYYVRRIARLAPAYYVSIAAVIVVFVPLGLIPLAEVTGSQGFWNVALHLAFLQHLVPLSAADFAGVNGVYWTLTIEFLFYLSLPLLVRWFGGRRAHHVPLICLGISVVWLWLALNSLDALVAWLSGSAAYAAEAGMRVSTDEMDLRVLLTHQFPTWLFSFAVGMWLARLMVRHRAGVDTPSWLRPEVGRWALLAGVALLLLTGEVNGRADGAPLGPLTDSVPVVIPAAQTAAVGLILTGLTLGSSSLRRPLEILPLRFIGWISYGLYLFHVPILKGLTHLTGFADGRSAGHFFWLYVCTILVTTLAASICWMFLERPSMFAAQALLARSGTRRVQVLRRRWRALVLGTTLIILPGVLIGQVGIRRGVESSYVGPLGQIRNVSMLADQTGPITLDDAVARGYIDESERQILQGCGAKQGVSEGLSEQSWGGVGLVFTCAGDARAAQALAAMPALLATRGFTRFDSGERTVMLHEASGAAVGSKSALPYRLDARYRSGSQLISVSLSCRSRTAGQDAIRRVIGPALLRFEPSR